MIKAKFIGDNHSMGFEYGRVYHLKSEVNNGCIVIKDINGKLWCPYSSMESFLANWAVLQIEG